MPIIVDNGERHNRTWPQIVCMAFLGSSDPQLTAKQITELDSSSPLTQGSKCPPSIQTVLKRPKDLKRTKRFVKSGIAVNREALWSLNPRYRQYPWDEESKWPRGRRFEAAEL